MPQDITINGAQYPDVPAVQIPKTGGGTAQFDDTTDATATAAEIASGKSAYVNNTRLVGTGQMVEPPLYIDPSINGVGIGATPENDHELTIANGYHINAKGKNNTFNYLPYSWVTTGSSSIGWLRIATITIHDTQFDAPVEFLVQRRHDAKSVKVSVLFNSQNTADPTLSGIYYDDISGTRSTNPFQAFIYKTGTSTWDVYVYMSGTYASISVYTLMPYYAQRWGSVSYVYGFLSAVPSGATVATPAPAILNGRTFTKTSGDASIDSIALQRSGALCIATFRAVNANTEMAKGANAWVGTTNLPKPVQPVSAAAYSGPACLVAYLNPNAELTIRVTGENWTAGYDTTRFALVYFTSENLP